MSCETQCAPELTMANTLLTLPLKQQLSKEKKHPSILNSDGTSLKSLLAKSFNLPWPQFPHLKNGASDPHSPSFPGHCGTQTSKETPDAKTHGTEIPGKAV